MAGQGRGGRTGPAPKPTERKRALGNPGRRPLRSPVVAIVPAVVLPRPTPMDGDGLVARILDGPARAWIGESDLLLVELIREAWDERLRLQAHIEEHGYGNGRSTPEVVRLDRVERNLSLWFSQCGLSPSDRSRLGVAEVRAQSKLEELRARREARGRPDGSRP